MILNLPFLSIASHNEEGKLVRKNLRKVSHTKHLQGWCTRHTQWLLHMHIPSEQAQQVSWSPCWTITIYHVTVCRIFFNEQSTRYTLTTACIFSTLSSTQCVWHEQGEFFKQTRPSLVGDHFLYSHDIVWFTGDTVRRN